MSWIKAPTRAEVMGWNPRSLADCMKRLKLSGCDKVVLRGSISGAQFMNMTERDLKVFPVLYVPIITKLQSEINGGKPKTSFGAKSKSSKCSKPASVQMDVWDSDEFDNDSDLDDDHSHQQEQNDYSFMFEMSEQQTAELLHDDDFTVSSLSLSAPKSCLKSPPNPKAPKPQESHAGKRSTKSCHPQPRKLNVPPKQLVKAQASQPSVQTSRSRRPVQEEPLQTDDSKLKGSAAMAAASSAGKPHTRPPKPKDVPNRRSLTPPLAAEPTGPDNIMAAPRQGLDLRWYRGKLTRHQGEAALREVNKDGAFMVRDSSKDSGEHLYTLMLLHKGKVYNIKIRSQGDCFYLGNGSNNKSFPGVTEMITHHTHTPLPLLDATDPGSELQPLCCLLHPAGP